MNRKRKPTGNQMSTTLFSSYERDRILANEPMMESFVFSRLLWAFDSAKWTEDERTQAESFVTLCKLVRHEWMQELACLSETNFSLAVDNWMNSLSHGIEFESDMWRRKVVGLIVAVVYGQDWKTNDFMQILVEKCRQLGRVQCEKDSKSLTRDTIDTGRRYIGVAIKTLLEFEKQSKVLHDFIAKEVLSRSLYPTAMRILIMSDQVGGALSTSIVLNVLNHAGQHHENINDDLKQLCDQGLLIRYGSRKRRLYVVAALKEAIGYLSADCMDNRQNASFSLWKRSH